MLSKEQKIEAYSWVENVFNNALVLTYSGEMGSLQGMCFQLAEYLRRNGWANSKVLQADFSNLFPEILSEDMRTKYGRGHSLFWFDLNKEGAKKRVKLLKEAIKTLEKQC